MSDTPAVQTTPWYGSTGFWNGLILAASGLVVGFPTAEGQSAVGALFALFASGNAIRLALKGAKIDLKAWISNKNTWNYIGATVVAIVPTIPVGVFEKAGDLATSALGGNWQGILTALFSIGTMLYFWLKPNPAPVAGSTKKTETR